MRRFALLRNPLVLAGLALGMLGLLTLLPAGEGTDTGLALLRMGLALTAILALAIAAVPALRRLPASGRRRASRLRCEEQLALDGRHRLALVSVDGRELLLGLPPDGFVLLADLRAGSGNEAQPAASGDVSAASDEFQRLIARHQSAGTP